MISDLLHALLLVSRQPAECFYKGGGNERTLRNPTLTLGEHAKSELGMEIGILGALMR